MPHSWQHRADSGPLLVASNQPVVFSAAASAHWVSWGNPPNPLNAFLFKKKKSIPNVIGLDFSLCNYQSLHLPHQLTRWGGHFTYKPQQYLAHDIFQVPNHLILFVKLQQLICKSSTMEMVWNFMKHCANQASSELLFWGVIYTLTSVFFSMEFNVDMHTLYNGFCFF